MLLITVNATELFNDATQEFIYVKEQKLQLEHSLVSLSKWESKWHTPFLNKQKRTNQETLDYIKCMTITQNVDDNTYLALSSENIKEICDYIDDPMTATTFNEVKNSTSHQIITSELIYYWMITLNIPMECQKWHLNRLMTLIKVCSIKSQKAKKMSKSEIANRNRALNESRKAQLNTRG